MSEEQSINQKGKSMSEDQLKRVSGGAFIDGGACIGCEICIYRCPTGAIKVINYIAVINDSKCVGCGNCREACPVGAIV